MTRRLHHHPHMRVAAAERTLHALFLETKHGTGLRPGRHAHVDDAIHRRHRNDSTECRLERSHRHFAYHRVSFAAKKGMRSYAHKHMQIPRRAAAPPRLALPGQAASRSITGPRWQRNVELAHFLDGPRALTSSAGRARQFAQAIAGGT